MGQTSSPTENTGVCSTGRRLRGVQAGYRTGTIAQDTDNNKKQGKQ